MNSANKVLQSALSRVRFQWNRLVSILLPVSVRFHRIYKNRHWGGHHAESASGLGSSLAATTRIRSELTSFFGDFGGFRPLELRRDPFGFPGPVHCIQDDGVSENRRLCVWRVDDLPAARR